jgi:hypothetical protein
MRKFIVIGFLLVGLTAIVGYKLYNKPHRNVEDEKAVRVDAAELFDEFQTDEQTANLRYLDKALEVKGTISEMLTNQDGQAVLVLKTNDPLFGISCTMTGPVTVQPGMHVTIKGFCNGYLSDVVMTNGILMK